MKTSIFGVLVVAILISAQAQTAVETPAQREARAAWWREARFGMFIHWDMSSIAGTEISWSRKATKPLDIYGEPAGYVEDPAYDNLYKNFNPTKFDARAWVQLAKAAGMNYLVFTAKHHGGFCMWDTKLTDYSIMHTPFKRDVLMELADACHAEGLRFGIYYSPRDWHHPDYGIGDNSKYVNYMDGQMCELLTNYGQVDVLWFDSYGHGDALKFWHIPETWALIKNLQPQLLINNRLAALRATNNPPMSRGDFDTPEQKLGKYQDTRLWESCMTVVDAPHGGWSYRTDGKVKSFEEAVRMLVSCATGDGNLLLDVGPDSTGVIPADQSACLLEVGKWLKQNGESIYGTRGGPFKPGEYGGTTRKENTIFVHVLKLPVTGVLQLPNIGVKLVHARFLTGGDVEAKQTDDGLEIVVPNESRQLPDTVVALEFDGSVMTFPAVDVATVANPASYLAPVVTELEKVWPTNRVVNLVVHGHSVPAGYFKTPAVDSLDAYPNLLRVALAEKYPHAVINVIVTAIGGENSVQGEARFAADVLPHKPDVVFIDYALNDRRIGLEKAGVAWRSMIQQTQSAGAKVVLLTPTPDQSAKLDDPDDPLNQHAAQIRSLAAEFHVGLVDSLARFKAELAHGTALTNLMSQVNHPNAAGHKLVAEELLKWFPTRRP